MRRLVLIVSILMTQFIHISALREHISEKSTFELKVKPTRCEKGKFRNGKGQCEKYATCKTIKRVKKERRFIHSLGYTKKLYIGNYSGVKVVYMVSGGYNFAGFRHGIDMIRQL